MDKYKEITNDWNYNARCTLTPLTVLDLVKVKLSRYMPWRHMGGDEV
jgi:hypothetical protein